MCKRMQLHYFKQKGGKLFVNAVNYEIPFYVYNRFHFNWYEELDESAKNSQQELGKEWMAQVLYDIWNKDNIWKKHAKIMR